MLQPRLQETADLLDFRRIIPSEQGRRRQGLVQESTTLAAGLALRHRTPARMALPQQINCP